MHYSKPSARLHKPPSGGGAAQKNRKTDAEKARLSLDYLDALKGHSVASMLGTEETNRRIAKTCDSIEEALGIVGKSTQNVVLDELHDQRQRRPIYYRIKEALESGAKYVELEYTRREGASTAAKAIANANPGVYVATFALIKREFSDCSRWVSFEAIANGWLEGREAKAIILDDPSTKKIDLTRLVVAHGIPCFVLAAHG